MNESPEVLKAQIMNQIRAAIDKLPALRERLERFVDIEMEATDRVKPNALTIITHVHIDRELIQEVTDDLMRMLVAREVAETIRYKVEEMKEVNIPAILAEALREGPMKNGDDEDQ